MTTPVAKIQVSINGGANQSGGITTVFGATVNLTATNTSGWSSALWQIYDYPPGFSLPSGWSVDASNVYYFQPSNPTTPPPGFSLPASGGNNWGSFAFRLTVSGNPSARNPDGSPNPAYVPTLTDESTILNIPSVKLAMRGIAANETTQFDTLRSWVGGVMQSLRVVDAAGGGGGSATAPLTLTGSSDTPQLVVKGWTTQTSALQQWQNSGATTVASVSNAGLLSASGIDAQTAGVFTVGGTTATGVTIGGASIPTTVAGTLKTSTIDTAAAGVLTIGASVATGVHIGSVAATVTVGGALTAGGLLSANNGLTVSGTIQTSTIDTAAAGAMTIAAATATSLALGSGTCATTVGGSLTVTGKLSLAAASGDYVAFGTAPSVTGVFRLTNAATVTARNGNNNGDVTMFYVNSANTVWVGDGANSSVVALQSNVGFSWYQNGTARLNITSSGLALICAGQTFHQAFVSGVSQNAAASDVATTAFTVAAMSAWSSAVTNVNGGNALIQGGAAKTNGTTGLRGGVRLQLGLDTAETMAEVAEVVVGQRVVSLCQIGSGVTSTQMPASTGDGVVYLANRNVVPAANAVGGGILYAESGALKWRGSSGTVTTVAVA